MPNNNPKTSWCFTLNNWKPEDWTFITQDVEGVNLLVVGKEGAGEGETPHLQGVVTWKKAYRFTQIKKLFNGRAHWEHAKDVEKSANYCMKLTDYKKIDNRKKKGSRSDLTVAAELIRKHRRKRDIINDPALFETCAKYSKWVDSIYYNKPKKQRVAVLKQWQQELKDMLLKPAEDRNIIWMYDKVGGVGKSFFTRHMIVNHDAMQLSSGKKADLLYVYTQEEADIVIFDLSRDSEAFAPYEAIELIKDGCFTSTKYQSLNVCREEFAHVIVFANYKPKPGSLSKDRVKVKQWVPAMNMWTPIEYK